MVRQEIRISSQDVSLLRSSHDHHLAVDLELRDPQQKPWPARVNGLEAVLEPSIPPLPESIPMAQEGRAYPQWWLAPLTEAMLDRAERDGVLVVELSIDDPDAARLKADRFRDQGTVFELRLPGGAGGPPCAVCAGDRAEDLKRRGCGGRRRGLRGTRIVRSLRTRSPVAGSRAFS